MADVKPKAVWVMRAGARGEDEAVALEEGLAIIGFKDVPDLRNFPSREALIEHLLESDPERSRSRAQNWAAQLWAFREEARTGDIVVLPLKTRPSEIALGHITGPYEFRRVGDEQRHVRPVKWEKIVPRSKFNQDLLYSFGAFMTVCRIQRNNAERRVSAVLEGKEDPGPDEPLPADTRIDIAQLAHDEIVAFVRQKFVGHDLARLVGAVLEAEGFNVIISPPGPDRGVDILAARGPLGFEEPWLCVQVKASETPVDVNVFRALQGVMTTFRATHGLLVSWGGFTEAVRKEARQHAFKIALWDQTDIVQAIYRTYERLSPEIQAELPLKRIWVLVREGVED